MKKKTVWCIYQLPEMIDSHPGFQEHRGQQCQIFSWSSVETWSYHEEYFGMFRSNP